MRVWFTSARLRSPATDQTWLASAPAVHGPRCTSTTPVGPIPHLPVPSRSSVAVGKRNTAPTPQTTPPAVGALGDRKTLCSVSPIPNCDPDSGRRLRYETTGTMVREITFQPAPIAKGITGCTFSRQRDPARSGPMPSS